MKTKKETEIEQLVTTTLDSGLFRTLSEPIRIELLKAIAVYGPLDIGDIASRFPQDRSVISRHLKMMSRTGLLVDWKEGRKVYYRVAGENFLQKLEDMAEVVRKLIKWKCPVNGNHMD